MAELPDWWNRVDQIMRAAGVPTRVWTAIAYAESSFIPWAANTNDPHGGSYGLFALNLAGQGKGYARPYLSDPINNAMIAAPYIAAGIRHCGSPDSIACIAMYSGHPSEDGSAGYNNDLVRKITGLFSRAAGKNGQEIYDSFTNMQGIPMAPIRTDPGTGLPTGLTDIPGQIGSGIESAFGSFFSKFLTAWSDAMIDQYANTAMGIAGGGLVIVGIILAAGRSEAGQEVIRTGTEAAAIGAVA